MSQSRPSPKLWPVANAAFVEGEIQHPRERQMHILFEDGPRLVSGDLIRFNLLVINGL